MKKGDRVIAVSDCPRKAYGKGAKWIPPIPSGTKGRVTQALIAGCYVQWDVGCLTYTAKYTLELLGVLDLVVEALDR